MVDDWIMKLVDRDQVLLWSDKRWRVPEWADLCGKVDFVETGWPEFRDMIEAIRENMEAREWFMT